MAIALALSGIIIAHILDNGHGYEQLGVLSTMPIRLVGNGVSYNTTVYLASTYSEQLQGYMNVSIPSGNYSCREECGMLFAFNSTEEECFWMENSEFPITQIWLNRTNGSYYVVTAVADAQPYSRDSICHIGRDVLEIPSQYSVDGLNVSKITDGYIVRVGG